MTWSVWLGQWFYRCEDVAAQARRRVGCALKEGRDLFYSMHEDVLSEKMLTNVVNVVAVAAAYRTLLPGSAAAPGRRRSEQCRLGTPPLAGHGAGPQLVG
jgi:hypothetical protein